MTVNLTISIKELYFFIAILTLYTETQNFLVNLNYPVQIDNNLTNAMAVGKDWQSNFIVSL